MFGLFAALALGSDLGYEISAARSKAPNQESLWSWVVHTTAESVAGAAFCVILSVLLSEAGLRASLSTGSQQSVFAVACVLPAAFLIWLEVSSKRLGRRQDREREARLAEARDLARQNVREFVDGLEVEKSSGQDYPHP